MNSLKYIIYILAAVAHHISLEGARVGDAGVEAGICTMQHAHHRKLTAVYDALDARQYKARYFTYL